MDIANDCISQCPALFTTAMAAGLRSKLGLLTQEADDATLAQDLLALMAASGADYTQVFSALTRLESSHEETDSLHALFAVTLGFDSTKLTAWLARWDERLFREPHQSHLRQGTMQRANPLYIPRNHLVEAALAAAVEQQDFGPFEELVEVLSQPFTKQAGKDIFALPPAKANPHYRTFCGT